MSSDYIPRLRGELLRAGESRRRRLRPVRALRPLVPVAAVGLIVAALVVAWPAGREDDVTGPQAAPRIHLTYRTDAARAEWAAKVLRQRFAAAGLGDARVAVSGRELRITAPQDARAEVAALTAPGELAVYDWERSVLGPHGRPAPSDPAVTGGQDAGRSGAVSRTQAEVWGLRAGAAQLVRAEGGAPGQWFALVPTPDMNNACVERAHPATDPSSGEPAVIVDLNSEGRSTFRSLTRQVAHRGADRGANQHLAIVIDDRIVSVPFIDYRQAPDGIDGSNGVQISGGMTPDTARATAAVLSSGPLPAPLKPK
jgi:hypothetical protein